MVRKVILAVGILALGLILMMFFKSFKKEPFQREVPAVVKSLTVTDVKYLENTPTIIALGKVESKNRLNLVSEVSGKVLNSSFKLTSGRKFSKGEILAVIDSEIQKNNLKINTSNLIVTLAEMLPDLKLDMPQEYSKWETFTNSLSFENIPALPEFSSSKEKIFVTTRGVVSQYYTLKNLQETLKKHIIRAPFTGTVASTNITAGSMASPSSPLAILVNTSVYEVKLPLPQNVINKVRVGMSVNLMLKDMDYSVKAKIVRISNVIDPQNQTQFVIVEFNSLKNSPIVDGNYVEANIKTEKLKSFKLPRAALFQDKFVIEVTDIAERVKKENNAPKGKNPNKAKNHQKPQLVGKAKLTPIDIVFKDREFVYISGGITENSVVVIEPTQDIDNNTLISPIRN